MSLNPQLGYAIPAETSGILPATLMISSPYDLDAHYSKKNTTSWIGYKVHLSETCEPNSLHLITNVETIAASIVDGDVTEAIIHHLPRRICFPLSILLIRNI
jgi:transposase